MIKFCPIILAICTMAISYSYSQSGTPDTSFGNFGFVATNVTLNRSDFLSAIVIQEDQKILAAGTTQNLTNADFAVVRYLPDGTLDPEFGDGGITVIDFNDGDDRAYGMSIQPDGRILVCGHADVKAQLDFAILRLNQDGQPDSTFGHDGKVTTDMVSGYEQANSVTVQNDGKIIIAGRVADDNFSNFGMVRYHPDGGLDETFGTDGKVMTNIREEDEAKSVAVQPDGKIILAGFASVSAKGDFAMVRYNQDGTQDKDFGGGGIVLTDLEGAGRSDFATSMVLQKNGQIVLAGNANFNNLFIESDIGVVRYNADGSLDEEFADNGVFVLMLGVNTQAGSVVQTPDGKYLIGGKTNFIFGQNMWLLFRLQNDGEPDPNFAGGGMVMEDLPGENEFISGMVIQRDSRIVVGGYNGNFNQLDFTLARYIADYTMSHSGFLFNFCNGDSSGIIVLWVDGGIHPYEFSIDGITFQSSPLFDQLPAGEYTITVKDSSGVLASYGPLIVTEPPVAPEIDVEVTGNSIIFHVTGSGELVFSIDGGETITGDSVFTDLLDGAYELFVMTSTTCVIYESVVVIAQTSVSNPDVIDFTMIPNPCSELIFVRTDQIWSNATFAISDLSGRILKSGTYPDFENQFKIDVSTLADGMYFLKLHERGQAGIMPFIVSR